MTLIAELLELIIKKVDGSIQPRSRIIQMVNFKKAYEVLCRENSERKNTGDITPYINIDFIVPVGEYTNCYLINPRTEGLRDHQQLK